MTEVRPIDANALLTKTHNYYPSTDHYCLSRHAVDVKDIDEAPTLDYEPVIHACWEWYEEPRNSLFPDSDYGWRCSHCKQDLAIILNDSLPGAYIDLDDPDNPPSKLMRCPNCGANMYGGKYNA